MFGRPLHCFLTAQRNSIFLYYFCIVFWKYLFFVAKAVWQDGAVTNVPVMVFIDCEVPPPDLLADHRLQKGSVSIVFFLLSLVLLIFLFVEKEEFVSMNEVWENMLILFMFIKTIIICYSWVCLGFRICQTHWLAKIRKIFRRYFCKELCKHFVCQLAMIERKIDCFGLATSTWELCSSHDSQRGFVFSQIQTH